MSRGFVLIDLATLRGHEQLVNANVRLGGYDMDKVAPTDEFQIFRGNLKRTDWQRLYLIGEFAKHTQNGTGRFIDVDWNALSEQSKNKITSFIQPASTTGWMPLDLRKNSQLALILVSADINSKSFVIIDGNHRAIAQYRKFGQVAGVQVIVCVHKQITRWPFVPHRARG